MTYTRHTRAIAAVCGIVAAFMPALSYADEVITFATTVANALNFNRSGDILYGAQAFTPSANAGSLTAILEMARGDIGFTANVILTVEGDNAGEPDGNTLGTASISGGTLTIDVNGDCSGGAHSTKTFPTITGLSLVSGTQYWLVVGRSMTPQSTPVMPEICDGTYTPKEHYYDSTWNTAGTRGFVGEVDLLTAGGGGGGGTATSTAVATSSVDQTQNNVWQGWWTFFAVLCLVVWLGRTR